MALSALYFAKHTGPEIDAAVDNVAANATAIADIEKLIPSQAGLTNQLADRNFVSSAVQNMAARFIGYTVDGGAFPNAEAIKTGPYWHAGQQLTADELTNHDYATVIKSEEGVENQYRYGYEAGVWSQQYKVGSALTADQTAALNSGITQEKLQKLLSEVKQLMTLLAPDGCELFAVSAEE